jgi:signal transduction histidine kinase
VLTGCGLAALAPVLADVTNGDPARSHLVLTLGTSLCALVMGADALVRLLRSQHARVLASEVDRVSADQALEAERAARSELDHDLTSALLAVEGAARVLERRERRPDSGDQHALAKAIASEIARLQQLLGGVRHDDPSGRFGIAAAILPVITCDLAQGVDVRAEVPRGLAALGSPLATAQVVRNLLDNAQRYAQGAPVRINACREGRWVCIRVEDAGPGIDDADPDRIFERGARGAETTQGGRGLGLFVAARLMAEQGGDLVLESTHPTSFCLRLPAVEDPAHG